MKLVIWNQTEGVALVDLKDDVLEAKTSTDSVQTFD